jgi:hypothetical protein
VAGYVNLPRIRYPHKHLRHKNLKHKAIQMAFWLDANDKLILDADDKAIECDDCPCSSEEADCLVAIVARIRARQILVGVETPLTIGNTYTLAQLKTAVNGIAPSFYDTAMLDANDATAYDDAVFTNTYADSASTCLELDDLVTVLKTVSTAAYPSPSTNWRLFGYSEQTGNPAVWQNTYDSAVNAYNNATEEDGTNWPGRHYSCYVRRNSSNVIDKIIVSIESQGFSYDISGMSTDYNKTVKLFMAYELEDEGLGNYTLPATFEADVMFLDNSVDAGLSATASIEPSWEDFDLDAPDMITIDCAAGSSATADYGWYWSNYQARIFITYTDLP